MERRGGEGGGEEREEGVIMSSKFGKVMCINCGIA